MNAGLRSDYKQAFYIVLILLLLGISSVQLMGKTPFEEIQAKAEHGDAVAQRSLGVMYARGEGVTKNQAEALKWFRKAADQGLAAAQYDVGIVYGLGEGVPQDPVEAFKWFKKAADQNLPAAMYALGGAYLEGKGVAKDLDKAFQYFKKSAESEYVPAEAEVGVIYMAQKDTVTGIYWLKKAADQGHLVGQYYLGMAYSKGDGVIKDEAEALAWCYLAKANGYTNAEELIHSLEKRLGKKKSALAQDRAKAIQQEIDSKASEEAPSTTDTDTSTAHASSRSRTPRGSGTGVILTNDGVILTAAHVIGDATRVKVVLKTGLKEAKILSVDANNDVAILKVKEGKEAFTPAPVIPSTKVKLGQKVFTLGFPNVDVQGTNVKMTEGSISSMGGIQDDPRQWQISVPVQPGNSGGPLFDENGNVVGIVVAKLNAMKIAKYTGDIPQNINYAVKSAYILPMLESYAGKLPPENKPDASKPEAAVEKVQDSVVLVLVY